MIDVRNLIERVGGDIQYREFSRSVGAPAVRAAPRLVASQAEVPAKPAQSSLLNRYAAKTAPAAAAVADAARTMSLAEVFQILEGRGPALRKSA